MGRWGMELFAWAASRIRDQLRRTSLFSGDGRLACAALLDRPAYFVAMLPLAMRLMGGRIEQWLLQCSVNLAWRDADVFHNKSKRGEIDDVLEAIRGAGDLVVVGPPHLRQLSQYLPYRPSA